MQLLLTPLKSTIRDGETPLQLLALGRAQNIIELALLHCDVLNIMDSALEYAMDLALELHCDHPRLMLLLLLLLLSLPPLLLLPLLLLLLLSLPPLLLLPLLLLTAGCCC